MTAQPTGLDLVVHEPQRRDQTRSAARLPEHARRTLGVLSGDTVVITGTNSTVATVWPARGTIPDDGIELDHTLRSRAGTTPGDTVRVEKAHVEPASSVTITTSNEDPIEPATVRTALAHRPVTTGDQYTINGTPVTVTATRPPGNVQITDTTSINLKPPAADQPEPTTPTTTTSEPPAQPPPATRVTYEDIGGLDEQLDLVRETIELPLTEPEQFDHLGIQPPTGILLYGPPGTGKTLIAEAVANTVDASFYHVSGPEITSKYKGESEERLREIFERARETAPAIVFFDEIDAVASEREAGSDMETRVVAQLLSLMDGLEPRGNVVVVGATNRIDTIDPALRRPGRFDREIEIGVPDETGRREIIAIHTANVPLADDVDLNDTAARTHGFVGADLRALVTEAALTALRRSRHEPADQPTQVTAADFESALAATEPSAMREFVAEAPETGFEDIGGLEPAKATLREAVEWPLTYPNLIHASGADPSSGILLYGPPGTGKTLLARAIAHETRVNFIHVAGPELIDKYVGESEKAVREVFDRARQSAPAIVFFDEIDAIASQRRNDNDVTERVVSQLLTELDGVADTPNLVVLAATNRKDALDPALLRPGRLETHIEVPLPDRAARRQILAIHTREMPLAEDVDLDELARDLDGKAGADLEAIARTAAMNAVRELVERTGETADDHADALVVTREHFSEAVNRYRQ